MDNKWLVSTIFIIVELVSVVTAGPVRSSVSCVSSVHPDGSASYRLSQPPPYHRCDTTWEDGNRIVIAVGSESAVGSERNASLVTHLTNQSIGLNVCLQRVTAEVECLSERISYKAECRANCSARTTKGPPLTCLGGWCPEPWKVLVVFAVVVGIAVLSYLVYRLWLSKRKGGQSFPAVAETHHDGTEDLGSYSSVKTSIS